MWRWTTEGEKKDRQVLQLESVWSCPFVTGRGVDELDGERKRSKVARNAKQKETKATKQFCAPFFFAQTNTQQAPGVDRERRREMVHQCKPERKKIKARGSALMCFNCYAKQF